MRIYTLIKRHFHYFTNRFLRRHLQLAASTIPHDQISSVSI